MAADTSGSKRVAEPEEMGGGDYAKGGSVHPHGHHVVRIDRHPDGREVHHHEHGGHTVKHADGRMTHHHHDGTPVHAAHGGMEHMAHGGAHVMTHPMGHEVMRVEHHHDGEIHHHAHGGFTHHHDDGTVTHHDARGGHVGHGMMGAEKGLIKKAFREHDAQEHPGEHTELHLARGGFSGERPRMPRGMRPAATHDRSPIEMPPKNPNRSVGPRNDMPGGVMGYGVEPSAEPDDAGSEQDIPQLARGGRPRHRR